jgi:hypothetical protein
VGTLESKLCPLPRAEGPGTPEIMPRAAGIGPCMPVGSFDVHRRVDRMVPGPVSIFCDTLLSQDRFPYLVMFYIVYNQTTYICIWIKYTILYSIYYSLGSI